MSDRAVSPVVGVALLALVTLLAAAVVGATATSLASDTADPPRVSVAASVNASSDRIALVHRGGDALDVTRLRVRVFVGGRPLAHQPPVPFFAATGFHAGPTGPFNDAADPRWTAGETASFRLAGTNAPLLTSGSAVTVKLYVGEYRVAVVRARA